MAEALTQVKSAMGSDAIILHTRTFSTRAWLGLRRREMVEITAGKGMNVGSRRRPPPGPAASRGEPAGSPADAKGRPRGNAAAIAGVYSRTGTPAASATSTATVARNLQVAPATRSKEAAHLLETPAAGNAAMLSLASEMTSLKTMVKDLVNATARHESRRSVPEEMLDYYISLVHNQVSEELADDIVRTIHRQVRPEHYAQAPYMRERMADQLEKMIPTAGPIVRTKTAGPHVVALIGPTGVGKTTTLAKLAANLKLREKHKVGLITLDTYRIAAVDQLKRYADIIGSPLRVVGSDEGLRDAMAAMNDCEFILIDTAGRSPNDTLKLSELKGLLAAANPDEVHLVLSTTASQACVELAVQRFGDVRVDKIIFTKIDEAAHVGVVLNVVRKVNKSLSYMTTGQDVPDDIEVGKGRRLAQMILGNGL